MIIVMQSDASENQINHAIERVEEKNLEAILLRGQKRNVIAAIGDKREIPPDYWKAIPGVERTIPILSRYKLASREISSHVTPVTLDGMEVGKDRIAVIAGPCAVESYDQVLTAAREVKKAGAVALRGGAYKPRTSPYSFRGLEEEGLKILAAAREETGLPVVTELLATEHTELVAEYTDVFQIGARNMQNYCLLEEVGQMHKPVLLKRGISASVDELLLAAEYILKSGNASVMLCLRGIRTFEDHTRYTLSIGALAHLKRVTHLPVIVDPSHPAGERSLVPPLARSAIAGGADGLLVETHPDPEEAQVDGAQSLTLDGFGEMMDELRPIAEAVEREL